MENIEIHRRDEGSRGRSCGAERLCLRINFNDKDIIMNKIKIIPKLRKRLKLGLTERTKERKRQEQKRRLQYFK